MTEGENNAKKDVVVEPDATDTSAEASSRLSQAGNDTTYKPPTVSNTDNPVQNSAEVQRILEKFSITARDAGRDASKDFLGAEQIGGTRNFAETLITRDGKKQPTDSNGRPISNGEISTTFRALVDGARRQNPPLSLDQIRTNMNQALKDSGYKVEFDPKDPQQRLLLVDTRNLDKGKPREVGRYDVSESPAETGERMANRALDPTMTVGQQEAFVNRGLKAMLAGMSKGDRDDFIAKFNQRMIESGSNQTLDYNKANGDVSLKPPTDKTLPPGLRIENVKAFTDIRSSIANGDLKGDDLTAALRKSTEGMDYRQARLFNAGIADALKAKYPDSGFGIAADSTGQNQRLEVQVSKQPSVRAEVPAGMSINDAQQWAKSAAELQKISGTPADTLQDRIGTFMGGPQGQRILDTVAKLPPESRQKYLDGLNASLPEGVKGEYKLGLARDGKSVDLIRESSLLSLRFSEQNLGTFRRTETDQRRQSLTDSADPAIKGDNRKAFADSVLSLENSWNNPAERTKALQAIETQLKSIPEGPERTAYLKGINDAAIRLQGNPKDGVSYKMERGSLQPVNFTTVKDGNRRDVKVDYPVGVTPDSDAGRAFKSLAEGITRGDDPTQMTEAVRQAFIKGNTDPRYLEAVNRVLQQRPGGDKFQFAPSSAGGLELQIRVDAKTDGNTSFEPVPKGLNFEQAKKYGEMLGEVRNSDKPDGKSTFDNGLGNRIAELLKNTPAAPPELRQRILAGINREIQTKYPAYGTDMLSVKQNADGQGVELRQGNDKVLSTYGRQSTDIAGVGKVDTPNGLNTTEAENYRNLLRDLRDPKKAQDPITFLNQNMDRLKADLAKLDSTQADLYLRQINDQMKARLGDKYALKVTDGKLDVVGRIEGKGEVTLPPGVTKAEADLFMGLAERALDPSKPGSAIGNDLITALKSVDPSRKRAFVDAFNKAYSDKHNGEYFSISGNNLELNRKRGMLDFTSPVIEKFKGDAASANLDNLLRSKGFDNPGTNTNLDAIRKSFADLRRNPGDEAALKTFMAGLKSGNFTESQMKAITDAFNQDRHANSRLDVSQLKDGVVKLGDMTVIAPYDKQLVVKGNLSSTDIADLKAVMVRLNGGDSVRGSTDLLTKVMGSVKDPAVRDSIMRGINDVLTQTQKNSMNKESIAFHPGGNGFDITTTDINNVKTTKWIKSNNVEVTPQDLATDTMNRLIQNPAAADARLMVKALEGNPEQLARAVENVLSGDPNASAKLKALFQNGSDTTKRMIENRLAQLGDLKTAREVGITDPALKSIEFAKRILDGGISGAGADVAKYLAGITDPKVRTMVMDNLISAINQKQGSGHTLEFNINNELLLKKGSTVVERFASGVARDYTVPAAVPDTAAIKATLTKFGITESNPVEAARKAQALDALTNALKSPTGDVTSALRVLKASGLSEAQLRSVAENINKERGPNDLQLASNGKSLVFKVNGKEISVPENLSRDRMNLVGELARKLGTANADNSRAMGDQLKAILEGLPADARKGLVDQLNGLNPNSPIKFNLAADGKNFTVQFKDKIMGARFDLAQPPATALDTTQMSARLAEMGIKDVPPNKVEQVYRAIDQLKRDLTNPAANIGESARMLKSLGLNEQQMKAATDAINAGLGDKPIKLAADGSLTFKVGEKSITLPDTLSPALMKKLQTLASELPTATKAQADKMAQRLKPILDTLPAETRTQLLSQLNNLAPGAATENKGVRFNINEGKLEVRFNNDVLGKPTDLAQPPKDQPALPGELNLTARESQLLEQYRKLIDGPPPLKPPSGGSFHHALVARAKEMGMTIPPAMLEKLSTTLRDNTFAAEGRKHLTTSDSATISNGKLTELLRANVPSTDVRVGDAQLGIIPPDVKDAESLNGWLATEAGAATVRDALASNNPQDRLTLARNLANLGVKTFTVGDKTFKTEVTRNGKVTLSLAGSPDAPIARGTFNRNGFRNDASVTPGDKLNGINFKDVPIKINGVDVPKRSDNPLAATTIRDLSPDQAKAHLQEKYGISEADPIKAKELYTKIETARRDLAVGKVDSVRELLAKLPTSGDGAARVIADLNSTAGTAPGALRINPETRNLEMRIGTGNAPADFVNLKSHPDSVVQDLVRLAKTNPELAKFKSDILNMPADASRNEAIKALLGQFKSDPFKMNLALLETIKVLKPANMSLSDFAKQYGDKLLPNNGRFHFDGTTGYNDLEVKMYDDTGKTKIAEFRIGEGNLKPSDSNAPFINRDALTRTLDALKIPKDAQADIYNRMDALRNATDPASRLAAYKALITTLDTGNSKVSADKFAEIAGAFNNQNVLRFNETTKSLMIPGNPDINLKHVKAGNGLEVDFFAPAKLDDAQTAKFAEIIRGFRNGKITENLPLMVDQLKGLSAPDRSLYLSEANRALDQSSKHKLVLDGNKLRVTKSDGSDPKEFVLPDAPPATSTKLDATTLPADVTVGAPRILDRTAAIAAGEALFTNPKFNPANPGEVPQKLGAIINALPPNERAQALTDLQAKLRTAWQGDPELAKISFRLDPTSNRLTVGREVEITGRTGGKSTEFRAIGQPVQLSDKATPLATVEQPAAAALTMPEMTAAQKAQFDLLKQLTSGGPLKPPSGGSFYQAIEQRAKALGLKLTHEQILPLAKALNKQFMVKGSVKQSDTTQKLTGDASGDARLARVLLGEKVPLIGATPDAPGTRNELPANATREQIQTWLKSDAGAAALRNAFSGNPQESLKMARILAQAGIDKFTAKGPDNKDVTFTIKQQKSGNTTRVTLGRMDGSTDTPVMQGDFGVRGAFKLNDTVAAQAFDVWKAFDWKKTQIVMDGIDVKTGTTTADAPAVTADNSAVPLDTVRNAAEATARLTELLSKPKANPGPEHNGELAKAFSEYIRAQVAERGKENINAIYQESRALLPKDSGLFLDFTRNVISLRRQVSMAEITSIDTKNLVDKGAVEKPEQMVARMMEPFLAMGDDGRRAQLQLIARELGKLPAGDARTNAVKAMQEYIAAKRSPLELRINPSNPNQIELGSQKAGKFELLTGGQVDIVAPDKTLVAIEKGTAAATDITPALKTAIDRGVILFNSFKPENQGNFMKELKSLLDAVPANRRKDVLAEIRRQTTNRALDKVTFLLSRDATRFNLGRAA